MSDIREILAKEIARGIIATGIEGAFDSIACSTAYAYPSLGVSQWEGSRGDELLKMIPGGDHFAGRAYAGIKNQGELPALKHLLSSAAGQKAQEDLLASDCLRYVDALQTVPTLDDTRCFIYAGMWCPTSHVVVTAFLRRRWSSYDLRSMKTLWDLFKTQYWIAADVGEMYAAGYANRARITYEYVAGVDLTTPYGIPAYGEAGNGK